MWSLKLELVKINPATKLDPCCFFDILLLTQCFKVFKRLSDITIHDLIKYTKHPTLYHTNQKRQCPQVSLQFFGLCLASAPYCSYS